MFHKQFGKVVSIERLKRPCRDSITRFFDLTLEEIERQGYTAWVAGRCAYDLDNASDFDLYLLGEIKNLSDLEDLIHYLIDCALNKCQFNLDVKWMESTNVIDTGNITDEDEFINNDVKYIEISYIKYYNTVTEQLTEFFLDQRRSAVKVTDWLVRGTFKGPYKPKPHQLEYFKQCGNFPKIPARDFIHQLAKY